MPVGKAAKHAANGAAQGAGYGTAGDVISALFRLLEEIRAGVDSTPSHLAFGAAFDERVLDDWPVNGHKRLAVPNRGMGGLITAAAAAYQDVVGADLGRGGLQLYNYGANPCFVYLAAKGDAQNGGVPTGYLGSGNGSWDGRISGEVWCGPVSIQSPLGTTLALAVI